MLEATAEYWNEQALKDPYSAILTGYTKEKFDKAKGFAEAYVTFNKAMVVLDLGCGLGRIAPDIAPKINRYIGMDFSQQMIRLAKERNKSLKNAEFICNNGNNISFENLFDIVIAELVVQHMTKSIFFNYMKEIHKALKEKGIFIAQIPKLSFYKCFGFTENELNFDGFTYENLDKDCQAYYMGEFIKC